MADAMSAEFDTLAQWTARVAQDLGPDHHIPGACRGSGSPASMRWLLQQLAVTQHDRMLDCGAGLGGPAAFARAETGVRPVLTDPEVGACRGASLLFGLPVVQAGSQLPFAPATMDVAWSLGVLCTVSDQPGLLGELKRVLVPGGRLGLLVYVAVKPPLSDQPDGNNFPTAEGLRGLVGQAGFEITGSASLTDFAEPPPGWDEKVKKVDAELKRRHGHTLEWSQAADQSDLMGALISSAEITAEIIVGHAAR